MRRHLTACPEFGSERTRRIDPGGVAKKVPRVRMRASVDGGAATARPTPQSLEGAGGFPRGGENDTMGHEL